MASASIIWFRQDLRLKDNPALNAAIKTGNPVIPVFIWSPEEEKPWLPGEASQLWLHHSLKSLEEDLLGLGLKLIIKKGDSLKNLQKLIKDTNTNSVFWNRRYEPHIIKRDSEIKETLLNKNIKVESFNSKLILEPWEVENNSGNPFKVFTPFWKKCLSLIETNYHERVESISPKAKSAKAFKANIESLKLKDLKLEPNLNWKEEVLSYWGEISEAGAEKQLNKFSKIVSDYKSARDLPSENGVSKLSPYLHFGQISPRMIWNKLKNLKSEGKRVYISEIGWREFAYHLLYHFPHTTTKPLRPEFEKFPWEKNPKALAKWQKGMTGYPIVDAGMRELYATGWMHNRVRMIVASFLIKDLMIKWQTGAEWFWDTLLDADLASNTMGWQWTAGSGADASPYFRIFNPMLQGERFDSNGSYVRKWVPELKALPNKWIHKPFEAPEQILEEAGLRLGKDYPNALVDHGQARNKALEAYKEIKK